MTAVFNFIGQFIDTISNGINALISFVVNIGALITNIIFLLPGIYTLITLTCLGILVFLITYKTIRKG